MKTVRTLFLILVTLLSLFVSITGLVAKIDLASRIFHTLFLPVTAYLLFVLAGHLLKRTSVFDLKTGFRRVVIYYCFIITASVVSLSFLSSRNAAQFISSLMFSPMAIYFLLLVWPRRSEAFALAEVPTATHKKFAAKTALGQGAKFDSDRRNFLKLIGSAGILALILGLFNRRGIPPFLGNVERIDSLTIKDSSGNVIDPAESSPTAGYYISSIDDSVPAYFGFIDKNSAWYVMKETEDGHYRYINGDSGFDKNWNNRAKLEYREFNEVF